MERHGVNASEQGEQVVVSAPPLIPFNNKPVCPKCGAHITFIERIMRGSGYEIFNFGYCPGGKNERVRVDIVPGVIQQEHESGCFGVFEEHLHIQCRRCGFRQLMLTKGSGK